MPRLFDDCGEVNVQMLVTLLEKDKFFNEGKVGKIRLVKLLMIALVYCRASTEHQKNLKLSLMFERI